MDFCSSKLNFGFEYEYAELRVSLIYVCEIVWDCEHFGFFEAERRALEYKCPNSRISKLLFGWRLSHVRFQSDLYWCDEVLIRGIVLVYVRVDLGRQNQSFSYVISTAFYTAFVHHVDYFFPTDDFFTLLISFVFMTSTQQNIMLHSQCQNTTACHDSRATNTSH